MSVHTRRVCVSVTVATVALALWYWFYPRLNAPARVTWKKHAMEAIQVESNGSGEMRLVASMMPNISREGSPASPPWMSDTRITMANGESVVFRNICQKEDFRIRDLFICKSSDGRWYFSTFHFCIGMTVFRSASAMDGQPASLHTFAQQYALEPFNPASDQCLRKTSPRISADNQ